MDIRRVQDLDEFLGRKLECKVIELNRNRNNVVLSRRAVLEDERREVRQKILDELQPGQVVEGVISNIVEFGAFVDLDGIDGLIHISELSWSHVNHPSEVLTIGEKVKVKVLDIDRDRQRISLGLKQTQADPWQSVIESYQVDDVVEGKVTKVVTFGAFVEIHAGVEGLVHISELAAHHVENPREVVNQGDVLAVRVIEIDADRRRLSLSLKRVADSDPIQHHLPDEIRGRGDRRRRRGRRRPGGARGRVEEAPAAEEAPVDEEIAAEEAVAEALPWTRPRPRRRSSRSWSSEASRRRPPSRSWSRRPSPRSLEEAIEEAVVEEPGRGGCSRRRPPRRSLVADEAPPRSWSAEETAASRGRRGRPRRRRSPTPTDGRGARRDGGPLCLALTGGIGSGKSEALAAFAACGAAMLSSDAVVHAIYEDPEVVAARRGALRRRGGRRRRPRRPPRCWGARAFAEEDGIAFLEALLHPAGRGAAARRGSRGQRGAASPRPRCWCARCRCSSRPGPRAVRRRPGGDRARGRPPGPGRGPRPGLRARSARQLPEAEKVARADRAYVNDGARWTTCAPGSPTGSRSTLADPVMRRSPARERSRRPRGRPRAARAGPAPAASPDGWLAAGAGGRWPALGAAWYQVHQTMPGWYARLWYPLEYEDADPGGVGPQRPRPGAGGRGHQHRERLRARTPARRRAPSG